MSGAEHDDRAAVRLLAEGKTNRVVCVQGETYVDYDITEALKMKKDLNEQTYTVMRALTGVGAE